MGKRVVRKTSKSVPKKAAPAVKKSKRLASKAKTVKKEVIPVRPKKSRALPESRKAAIKKSTLKAIVTAKKVFKPPKSKMAYCPKGYTAAEYLRFRALKNEFEEKSNQQLKDLLRKNLQSMSGNKDDLVYKCADGAVLGGIPRCPRCYGGRPKFDFRKGTYHCSGYRDDTDFHNCHTTFQKGEITRNKWEN